MNYDEDSALTAYVWTHCYTYMTDFERAGVKAVHAREKAAAVDSEQMKQMILDKWGSISDPNVVAALADGHEAFRIAVRDRVLRDHPGIVARCPRCNAVLRTPNARQCRWCLHDWHQ
jgi:hypothetical protein